MSPAALALRESWICCTLLQELIDAAYAHATALSNAIAPYDVGDNGERPPFRHITATQPFRGELQKLIASAAS